MNVIFYEAIDTDEQRLEVPWADWLRIIEQLPPPERRDGRDTFEVHWRVEDSSTAKNSDGVLVLSRDRRQNPGVTDHRTSRTSPAPPVQGGDYSERLLMTMVHPRVAGVLRIGNEAARVPSATAYLSHRTGLTDNEQRMLVLRRIISPMFLEKLQKEGNVVSQIRLGTTLAGARRLWGKSAMAQSRRLRRRAGDHIEVGVTLGIDKNRRTTTRLTEAERLDTLALLDEARQIAGSRDVLDTGSIKVLTPDGTDYVHLTDAYLSTRVRVDPSSRWVSPLDALELMHQAWRDESTSQVKDILGL